MDNQKNISIKNEGKVQHLFTLVFVGILCCMVIVFVFSVGVFIGQERARFSSHWTENYYRNFAGPQNSAIFNLPGKNLISGHGIFGQVIKIDDTGLVIRGQDGMEKTVIVLGATFIRNNKSMIEFSDIRVGDTIIIIGEPDDAGQIEARFIRVLPQDISLFLRIDNLVQAVHGNL